MANRAFYPPLDPTKVRCSFCGSGEWTGVWMNGSDANGEIIPPVAACRECAARILPALTADSLWQPGRGGESILQQVRERFWRAMFCLERNALGMFQMVEIVKRLERRKNGEAWQQE